MLTQLESPYLESDRRPTRLPPIRILDILVLTAAMALVFSIQEKMNRQGGMPETNAILDFAFQLVYAIPAGISLAAAFWFGVQKRRTGKYFWQPGHWVLAAVMCTSIGMLAVWTVILLTDQSNQFESPLALFGTLAAIHFGGMVFLILAAIRHRGIWRWFMVTLAATMLVATLMYTLNIFLMGSLFTFNSSLVFLINAVQAIMMVLNVFALVILVTAVVVDHRAKNLRDWLHWMGVMLMVFRLAVEPVMGWIMIYLLNKFGADAVS